MLFLTETNLPRRGREARRQPTLDRRCNLVGTTAAVIMAGAAVASAGAKQYAAGKAASAQKKGLDAVEGVNIADVANQAAARDIQKQKDQFAAQAATDPASAALRTTSNEGLQRAVFGDPNEQNANTILQTLFDENINIDPNDVNFVSSLKSRAQEVLDQGGRFSGEQQAELVRAGLEQGGQAGFSAGSSATRQGVGKLLASESERLAAEREARARDLFGFATATENNRVNVLGDIGEGSLRANAQKTDQLFNIANLADERVPNIGLSGGDIANLAVSNTNLRNKVALAKAGVRAQKALATGDTIAGLAGSLGTMAGQQFKV